MEMPVPKSSPDRLIYGLTRMSLAECNHVSMWCHWSFLSLTCHQLASLGNIFDVRVVHVLHTPPIQPLKLYLSPAHQFVLTGLPQWWLHHPDAAEQLASQPWHAVKRSSQPSVWAFFCPIKPQSPSHPVQPATISQGCVSLFALHAQCAFLAWMILFY